MGKNILIFSDGTGQAGGVRPDQDLSNVYKLYRATRVSVDNSINPADQVAYYDPGLGTQSDGTGVHIRLIDRILQILGSLTGSGITQNIIDCYQAILRMYEPGDRIYLFGFSRGAYTVRSLASVLNLCGVPTTSRDGSPLPRSGKALRQIAEEAVTRVYEHGAGWERAEFEDEREELARRFRIAHHSEEMGTAAGTSKRGNVAPEFIGVFDTVAALGSTGRRRGFLIGALVASAVIGSLLFARVSSLILGFGFPVLFLGSMLSLAVWIWHRSHRARRKVFISSESGAKPHKHYASWRMRNYDRFLDRRTGYARQALAIDETRTDFVQVGWGHSADMEAHKADPIPWLKQVWFAGNHSDIGGSYPETESRLSDIALEWMVEEATAIPFPINIDRSKLQIFPRVDGAQHCEVERLRDRMGKLSQILGYKAAPRNINPQAELHPTVYERFELGCVQHCKTSQPYRPESLRQHALAGRFYEAD